MTKFQIIEGTAARKSPQTEPMTPERLARTLYCYRQAAPLRMLNAVPLTRAYQQVLLDYVHFLGREARRTLLLRLAGEKRFFEPLLYELCARADRDTLREALRLARTDGDPDTIALLERFTGETERPGLRARLLEHLLGLAY